MPDPAEPPVETNYEIGGEVREKCAVIEVNDPEGNAAEIARLGLTALQHRGQEGAGIEYTEHDQAGNFVGMRLKKALGRIATSFKKGFTEEVEYSEGAGGQARYGTTEVENEFDGLQPIWKWVNGKLISFKHNGQFTIDNLDELAEEHGTGYTGSDSERTADLFGLYIEKTGDIETAIHQLGPKLEGAFSLTIRDGLTAIGIRDRHGMRPLVTGSDGDKGMIASEVTALKAPDKGGNRQLDFKLQKIVAPGTYVVMDENGGFRHVKWTEKDPNHCIFEDIYLSMPDNVMTEDGITAGEYRINAGATLANKETANSDMIVPVLGSAKTYAKGYEAASDIPYMEGLQKNPDRKNPESDRTFIAKTQEEREAAVRDKFIVDKEAVKGKIVTLIDDSLVRGTTMKVIIEMLREGGAQGVHVRIGSPKYTKPCAYGVNVQSEKELLSYNRTTEQMAEAIGADSLEFLTNQEMYDARGVTPDEVCDGCMSGSYPKTQKEISGIKLPMAA